MSNHKTGTTYQHLMEIYPQITYGNLEQLMMKIIYTIKETVVIQV